jgi:hypothetical protein
MIILLRIFLISLIIYLLVRSFVRYFQGEEETREVQEDKNSSNSKKISKEIGEYVDYEEIDKE